MPDAIDPYTVLGVPRSATPAEITRAYRQKLRAQHPDTRSPHEGATPVADEQLRRLLSAYAILRDSARRAAFDRAAQTTTQPQMDHPPGGDQRVDIPVTHNPHACTDSARTPPLWAGPVRRHR
jgi:curved DNA-binding protein CbpA